MFVFYVYELWVSSWSEVGVSCRVTVRVNPIDLSAFEYPSQSTQTDVSLSFHFSTLSQAVCLFSVSLKRWSVQDT